MPGCQRSRSKITRRLQHIAKLHPLIASHTRDRCFTRQIRIRKIIHHGLAKIMLIVQNIMRNANTLSNNAGIVYVLPCTAGPDPAHRFTMIIKLKRNPHHVIALLFQQRRRNRRVHPARHGHHHAGLSRFSRQIQTIQARLGVIHVTHEREYRRFASGCNHRLPKPSLPRPANPARPAIYAGQTGPPEKQNQRPKQTSL